MSLTGWFYKGIDIGKLLEVILDWRAKYDPACQESFTQVDSINLALPELAENIYEVIGYDFDDGV